jgi:hypothetical protein
VAIYIGLNPDSDGAWTATGVLRPEVFAKADGATPGTALAALGPRLDALIAEHGLDD